MKFNFLVVGVLGLFPGVYIHAENLPAVKKEKIHPMSNKIKCGETAIEKDDCKIRAILEDVNRTYKHPGGGGISEIRALSTNAFKISLPQEERVDEITYEFEVSAAGELKILKRTESTKSFNR